MIFEIEYIECSIIFIIISYKMTEVIKKQNIIDMPDNSDMIAEAMKYLLC